MTEVGTVLSGVDIDRGRGVPLAQEVARVLAGVIRSGEIPAGQKLPATEKLAGLLGVSQQVAQHALSSLADRNLVRRKPGLGTVVLQPRDVPVIGLLSVVGGAVSLTADVGWVIANDFINVMSRRGVEHREYIRHRESGDDQKLPPNLVDDLMDDNIDALMVGGVYEGIVRECAPASEVPALHLSPRQTESVPAIEDAVRWLWREDCRRVGAVMEPVEEAQEVARVFRRECGDFNIEVPAGWLQMDCTSSIPTGRQLFHDLFQGGEGPDGLLVMDDIIAYGLLDGARQADYRLDTTCLVVMVNKGSNLFIPPSCPRIELDWEVVIERELDRWLRSAQSLAEQPNSPGRIYRFRPRPSDRSTADFSERPNSPAATGPPLL
jgi:hypothetical protein